MCSSLLIWVLGSGNPAPLPAPGPCPPMPGWPLPNSRVTCSPGMISGTQSATATEAAPTRRPAAATAVVSGICRGSGFLCSHSLIRSLPSLLSIQR